MRGIASIGLLALALCAQPALAKEAVKYTPENLMYHIQTDLNKEQCMNSIGDEQRCECITSRLRNPGADFISYVKIASFTPEEQDKRIDYSHFTPEEKKQFDAYIQQVRDTQKTCVQDKMNDNVTKTEEAK